MTGNIIIISAIHEATALLCKELCKDIGKIPALTELIGEKGSQAKKKI